MGSSGSKGPVGGETSSTAGRWLCVDTSQKQGIERLEYDPAQSRAVLCAVNKFQNDVFIESDIPVPVGRQYSDAQKFSLCLQGTAGSDGGLEGRNIAVLDDDSDGALGYIPTKENVLSLLKEQVRDVGRDGMLVFYFSGHARRTKEGNVYLLPTDYDSQIAHGINSADLSEALKNSAAKWLVIVLDCCNADGLAHELVDFGGDNFIQCVSTVYAVVACSGSETTLFHNQIGGGVFSYFLIDHLDRSRNIDTASLDLVHSVRFCQPLYSAVSWIARYFHTSADSQQGPWGPQLVSSNFTVRELQLFGDLPDGASKTHRLFDLLSRKYIVADTSPERMVLHPPEKLRAWLRTTVIPSLAQLECTEYVSSTKHPALFNALVAMVSTSAAEIVLEYEQEKCLSRNLFIHCIVPVIDSFYTLNDRLVDEWDVGHVVLALRYYMAAIKEYREPQVNVEELADLIHLLIDLQTPDTVDGKADRQGHPISIQDVYDQLPRCRLAKFPSS